VVGQRLQDLRDLFRLFGRFRGVAGFDRLTDAG